MTRSINGLASAILALGLALGAPSALAQDATASAPRTLRYSDHEPLGGMRTRFLKEVFFAEIEKETRGRIRIDEHWNGELADSHGVLAAVSTEDKADIGVIVPEYFAKQMPRGQLFKSFLTGPAGQAQVDFFRQAFAEIPAFGQELERNGLAPIFYATGYPVAFYSREPLKDLDGIAGQKWRTASFWHRDFLRNVGAEPVSIPWGQGVFDGLRKGEIDGLMVNVDSGYMLDVHTVAPHVLASRKLWLGHVYIIAINSRTWRELAEEDRAAIQRAAQTAYAKLGAVMDQSFDAMRKDLADAGAVVRLLTDAEVERFASRAGYAREQSRWVSDQEASGTEGIKETFDQLKSLMHRAAE